MVCIHALYLGDQKQILIKQNIRAIKKFMAKPVQITSLAFLKPYISANNNSFYDSLN